MPGIECLCHSQFRFDYTTNEKELAIIKRIFNGNYIIPQIFDFTARVFDPFTENDEDLSLIRVPEHKMNPQTNIFCDKLEIDDPINLIEEFNTKPSQLFNVSFYKA